jgi:hypothetical protein
VALQLLSRQLAVDSADFAVLRALGMTPGQLLMLATVRLATITSGAGLLAVVVAILASPLTPIGPARLAEPQPGTSANVLILVTGGALLAAAPLVLMLPAAWRSASRPPESARALAPPQRRRPARLTSGASAGRWVSLGQGLRMAFQPGQGAGAVPVRSAVLGTVVAISATVAALVFSSSFVHLLHTPAQYGQNCSRSST